MSKMISDDISVISSQLQNERDYWLKKMSGELIKCYFPTDNIKKYNNENQNEKIDFKISGELFTKVLKLSNNSDARLYMILSTALIILINKYTSIEDIIIASPIFKQSEEVEYINTLILLRNQCSQESTFKQLLIEFKKTIIEATENQNYPVQKLLYQLGIEFSENEIPLIDIMILLKNIHDEKYIKDIDVNTIFSFEKEADCIVGTLEYNKQLYKRETAETITVHFLIVLEAVLTDLNIPVKSINLLRQAEEYRFRHELNATYKDYPSDKTIIELFEAQVDKSPDKIFVVYKEKTLSYRQLNEKANKLARNIISKGVKSNDIVGIMVRHSIEMIVAIIGVLKSGGGYLPVDPDYPADRIEYMLKSSDTKVLLTQDSLLNGINFDESIINLDDEHAYLDSGENLGYVSQPADLAYVIYTSGSTGMPKGVMIDQRALINYVYWAKKEYICEKEPIFPLFTSFSFDLTITSVFVPLFFAGKIIIYPQDEKYNLITKIIKDDEVSIIKITPAHLELIKELQITETHIETIIVGGEQLKEETARKVYEAFNKKVNIYNEYGPTETTVGCISHKYDYEKDSACNVPIGKPGYNMKIYILDKSLNLVPQNIPGEIYISGEGLARGYLGNPKLTEERFITNPFDLYLKMYKTGDIAKWNSNNDIEFIGRIDQQIKIRGFRIETEEIEDCLLKFEAVKGAVVLDKEDESGNKYLCAYIVSKVELTSEELREYLSEILPDYMIPTYFVFIEEIPQTSHGKIDKKLLLGLKEILISESEYEAPRNEIEKKMVNIWEDILKHERISINDNFFHIGGHSLKVAMLVSKIHKELDIEVPLREVFKTSTVKGISEYIAKAHKSEYIPIHPAKEKEYYKTAHAQKRMYLLQQLDLSSIGYNIPEIIVIDGKFEKVKLENAFKALIQRHETLRTSFFLTNGEIVQKINTHVSFEIEYTENLYKSIDEILAEFVKPFDLSKAPLLRVFLVKLEEHKNLLMFDTHHIISDGTSISIWITELARLYEGKHLKALKIQYKDYSEWQGEFFKSERFKKQEGYWISRFSNEIPVLAMPTDYSRPQLQNFEGDSIRFKINSEITQKLKNIAKNAECTMYMVFLSAINILLSKYSGQSDIIIGTPIAGRANTDLEKMIGMFVNTLAMRNYLNNDMIYEDFLKEVRKNALEAYENQDYPFEELVDKISLQRDISRNPLFDVMFALQNMDIKPIELENLSFKQYEFVNKVAKFDLTFFAWENAVEYVFNLQYSTKLFKKETIERMIEHFTNILNVIANDKKIMLKDINVLSNDEVHKLLYEFNDTYSSYRKDKLIHELFEEQVQKKPDKIAIIFQDRKLTYKELNEKANSLARMLRKKNVGRGHVVALMMERCPEMIVGILAIIKAGAAYLPIDIDYPAERIAYMLQDSQAQALLISQNSFEIQGTAVEVIDVFDIDNYIHDCMDNYSDEISNISDQNKVEDILYITYTSGTTGKPKGVMIKHKNIVNLIDYQLTKTNIDFQDRVLQFTPISFDVSCQEIFSTLLSGGELQLIDNDTRRNMEKLLDFIEARCIKIIFLPTAYLREIIRHTDYIQKLTRNVKHIIIAGEQLVINRDFYSIIKGKEVYIHNHYGPSETHVVSTYTIYSEENYGLMYIPIGKPISNTNILIINDSNQIVPIGSVGEVYISGDCIGGGYINNQRLTAERFINNPFKVSEIMYKTGDLAKWLPDGNIEFTGRSDNQVKIRGFRIELEEIEKQLLGHEAVNEVIVIDKEDSKREKYLCAYTVSTEKLKASELRRFLSYKLPDYMIPTYFMHLEKMPLTSNGKIDKKALPEPNKDIETGMRYEEPKSKVEKKLAELWGSILGLDKVSVNDSFFAIGGHSMKVMRLVSEIKKEFKYDMPVNEIFKKLTIRQLSEIIPDYVGMQADTINEKCIILKDASYSAPNMFLIHDGSGDIGGYFELCKNIKNDIKCWGITADKLTDYAPERRRIEDIASEYISCIRRIQSEGPYNIAGWSLGGIITIEIIRQLEEMEEKIGKIVLFDSYPSTAFMSGENIRENFELETEKQYISEFIIDANLINEVLRQSDLSALWRLAAEYWEHNAEMLDRIKLTLPQNLLRIISNNNKIDNLGNVYKINIFRTLSNAMKHYKPHNKIKAQIYFIGASESRDMDSELLKLYCERVINYKEVTGNHYTIFENPNVKELAEVFDEILLKANDKNTI